MSIDMEKSNRLASLAVFRELYDTQNDIYSVLAAFLKDLITAKGKHQFNLTEITQMLNNTYDFIIPEAVVKTSLKRLSFVKRSQGAYNADFTEQSTTDAVLSQKHTDTKLVYDSIITNIFNYIETNKKILLTDEEKEKIVHSFCSYLLNEATPQEYSSYISAFIIQHKQNSDFTKKLNRIKEGVVLYTGLKYNSNLNELGSWDTNLTIYLDTEILFSLAGYNGELFNALFNDFFMLVVEINSKTANKNGRKIVQLKYFKEVANEVEGYFKVAESIIAGTKQYRPTGTAMRVIMDGCKTPSDVINKKAKFYLLLQSKGIQLENKADYYVEENYKFNIDDPETIKDLEMGEAIKPIDVENCLTVLNYINILRKDDSKKNFENIEFILLTGNSISLQIARNKSIKKNGDVPLATTLDFLTNKFWFKLNKGFGTGNYPKTFDIITKAQIVLSTLMNKSVAKAYDELVEKTKQGEITEEHAKATIVALRQRPKKPEEINEPDIPEVLRTITESNIEQYIREQELAKQSAIKQAEENMVLKKTIKIQQEENQKQELEYRKQLDLQAKENARKDAELKKHNDALSMHEEKIRKRTKKIWKAFLIGIIIVFVSLGILLIIYRNTIWGVIITVASTVLGIFKFFGYDYNRFRELFHKK